MERLQTAFAYFVSLLLAWFSRHSPQDIAFMVGSLVAVGTLIINLVSAIVNWHYRRKTLELLRARGMSEEVANEFNR
ncbi:hypothetical protein LLR08_16480 [Rouxiella badensis]|jgi:hypothetical protein|uniref:hypothetical protein n=1 Tax=Rouxiella badensis TaxID=1646377 RepID=UPI000374AB63|nr:hypothetical protein [Rouxiella badensis]MCC3704159.1 hypothetical protein [Rouxiella badensis]